MDGTRVDANRQDKANIRRTEPMLFPYRRAPKDWWERGREGEGGKEVGMINEQYVPMKWLVCTVYCDFCTCVCQWVGDTCTHVFLPVETLQTSLECPLKVPVSPRDHLPVQVGTGCHIPWASA